MNIKNILKKAFPYKIYAKRREQKRQEHLQYLSMLLKTEGVETLQAFSKALNDAGIQFWLDYGTLLGYHREHDFISHDNDLDTGAFIEDAPRIKETLENAGFKLVRFYYTLDKEGVEHCYCKLGCTATIDVFFYKRIDDSACCYNYYPLPGIKIENNLFKEIPFTCYTVWAPFSGLRRTSFKGSDVYVPIDIEGYLIANYGPNYMIPDQNFSSSSATNIHKYTYEEKPAVGYLEIPY